MKPLFLRVLALAPLALVVACDESTTDAAGPGDARSADHATGSANGAAADAAELAWFESTGERVEFTNVGLSIERPAGFAVASGEAFDGLSAPDHGSAIVVARLPGSFDLLASRYTAEAIEERGTTVLSSEEREVAGLSAVLHHGTSDSEEFDVRRLLVFFGDERGSYLVTVNTPADLWPSAAEDLVAAALGVERIERRLPDAPPFALGDPSPLVEQLSTSGRMFTEEAELDAGQVAARFLAGTSRGRTTIDDRAAFLLARLEKLTDIADLGGESTGLVIDNRPAERFVGTYRDANSGAAMHVHATLIVEPDGRYVFLLGTVDAERRPTFEPVFTGLADGFARN